MLKEKINLLKFLIFLILITLTIILIEHLGIKNLLNLKLIKETITSNGDPSPLLFLVVFIISLILFIPETPFLIISGVVFGPIVGTAYSILGMTLGSIVTFRVSRYLGKDFVESLLKNKFKKAYKYDGKIEKSGFLFVLSLRLIPIIPTNLLSASLSLTKVKRKSFIIGTAIGRIPETFIWAYMGNSMKHLSPSNIIIGVSLYSLLILAPFIYKKFTIK